jgi:hypothetical protein
LHFNVLSFQDYAVYTATFGMLAYTTSAIHCLSSPCAMFLTLTLSAIASLFQMSLESSCSI